jgi:FixJ family two-component response regulator
MNLSVIPTVHIVDDDSSLRLALSRLLSAAGYQVETYESADGFLAANPEDMPACILLDVNMPGLNGVQLQEHLVRQMSHFPIVFLTGHGDIAMSVRAIKAGAEDFLSKPVAKEDLLDAVQRALQRCRDTYAQRSNQKELLERVNSLTAREREVFDLLVTGMLNKQIAYQLGNTERTVKAHRHSIMEKMRVKSMAELASIASQLGILKKVGNAVHE